MRQNRGFPELPDTPTCASFGVKTLSETALSRYLLKLSRGLAWHWEVGLGEGGGGPLSALGFGRWDRAFSSVHGELLRLEARQVKTLPA